MLILIRMMMAMPPGPRPTVPSTSHLRWRQPLRSGCGHAPLCCLSHRSTGVFIALTHSLLHSRRLTPVYSPSCSSCHSLTPCSPPARPLPHASVVLSESHRATAEPHSEHLHFLTVGFVDGSCHLCRSDRPVRSLVEGRRRRRRIIEASPAPGGLGSGPANAAERLPLSPVISLVPPLVCLKRSPSTRTLGQSTSEESKRKEADEPAWPPTDPTPAPTISQHLDVQCPEQRK